MKNLIFALTLVIGPLYSFSQNSAGDFWKNRCDFKTDGSGKSNGLKIKLSVPCKWKQFEGDRPHVVKKFTYIFSDTSSVLMNITVTPLEDPITQKDIEENLSEKGLKRIGISYGTTLSVKQLTIDGIKCGEIVSKMERKIPAADVKIYSMAYVFYYKNLVICIMFAAGSESESKSKKRFDEYEFLFKSLASQTVILSQWE